MREIKTIASTLPISFVLLLLCPANHKLKSNNVQALGHPFAKIKDHENICASHSTCSECSSSEVFCHWCSSDEACHSAKNWKKHSCVIGADCKSNNTQALGHPFTKIEDHEDICASHSTCSECSSSEVFCHWCSSDDACHSTKNWMKYSCVIGADCHSIERCQRTESERLNFNENNRSTISGRNWTITVIGLSSFGAYILWAISSNRQKLSFGAKNYFLSRSLGGDIDDLKMEEVAYEEDDNQGIELRSKPMSEANKFCIDDQDNNGKNNVDQNDVTNNISKELKIGIKKYEKIDRQEEEMPTVDEKEFERKSTLHHLKEVVHGLISRPDVSFWIRWIQILITASIISASAVLILLFFPKAPEVNIW